MYETLLGLIELRGGEDLDESEYLFQPRQQSNNLRVFHIPEKRLDSIELEFSIPWKPGFCHIKNVLYLAGGVLNFK